MSTNRATHAGADQSIEAITRKYELLLNLIDTRRKHGPEFDQLLSALLKIVRPIVHAGAAVSVFDVVMDARAGTLACPPDGMACPDFSGTVALLRRYPRRFIFPLCFTALSSLELEFGRMEGVAIVDESASLLCYPPVPEEEAAVDAWRVDRYKRVVGRAPQVTLPSHADLAEVAKWLPQTRGWWLPH